MFSQQIPTNEIRLIIILFNKPIIYLKVPTLKTLILVLLFIIHKTT